MENSRAGIWTEVCLTPAFPHGASDKEPDWHAGGIREEGSISGSGRFPGEGNGNPLQYSCLDRGT